MEDELPKKKKCLPNLQKLKEIQLLILKVRIESHKKKEKKEGILLILLDDGHYRKIREV